MNGLLELPYGSRVTQLQRDPTAWGECAALREHLERWPRAEVAYAIRAGRTTVVGVGTIAGAARSLRRLAANRELRVKLQFVRRDRP